MKRSIWFMIVLSSLFSLTFGLNYIHPVMAQSDPDGWALPVKLFETLGRASEAEVIADSAGTVHVFWAYSAPEDKESGENQAIYYLSKKGGVWSQAVDILVSPGGQVARMPSIVLDEEGYLHIVWSGGSALFYSRASALEAGSASGWLPVQALTANVSALEPDVAVASDGMLYAVWTQPGAGLMFSRSENEGVAWNSPQVVFATSGTEELARWGRLAVDGLGRVHLVLTHVVREVSEGGERDDPNFLYYLRSEDTGDSWSDPFLVSDELNFGEINVVTYGDDVVHLAWNGRAGRNGRYHRWTDDSGLTWSAVNEILRPSAADPISNGGLTGFPAMAVDGTGVLHLVSATGPGDYYFRWENGQWSQPFLISPGLDGRGVTRTNSSLEQPSVSISAGNQLHVVFHDGFERIWYVTKELGIPPIEPIPYPTMTPITQPEIVKSPPPNLTEATPVVAPAMSGTPPQILRPWQKLMSIGGPGALLVIAVVLFVLRQRTQGRRM